MSPLPDAPFAPPDPRFGCAFDDGVVNGASSLGTISMRKSNWSDFDRAFDMSERESVRRLFESAMMNARAVISDMNTDPARLASTPARKERTHFHRPCRRGWALRDEPGHQCSSRSRQPIPTVRCNHLLRPGGISLSHASGSGARRWTHLDFGVALHDLFDTRQRERGMPVVGGLLLGGVDLPLPK